MGEEFCGTCKFYNAMQGQCRRYPPTSEVIKYVDDRGLGSEWVEYRFPRPDTAWWCGEWQTVIS